MDPAYCEVEVAHCSSPDTALFAGRQYSATLRYCGEETVAGAGFSSRGFFCPNMCPKAHGRRGVAEGLPAGQEPLGFLHTDATRLSGRALRDFHEYATPEQRERMMRAQTR